MSDRAMVSVGSKWQCATGTKLVVGVKGYEITWRWLDQKAKDRTCWITTWNEWVSKSKAVEVLA